MLRLKRLAFALSMALALTGAAGLSASAQDHHDHDHGHGGGPHGHGGPGGHPGLHGGGFHGHDFAHFSPGERALWVGGGWHHQWFNGRFGWWWAVGGLWYFYPTPIYPYPDYVADVYYDPSMAPGAAPMAPVAPVAGAPPGYWYYCSASSTYYPYVQNCAVPWTPVAPTPPGQGPSQ
jgi:hypothetical protein